MTRAIVILFLAGWLSTTAAQENSPGDKYLVVLGDYLAKPDQNHLPQLKSGYGLDVRYGEILDEHWGYELGGFYGQLQPETASAPRGFRSGVGADAVYRFPEFWYLTPIVLGGGGIAYSDLGSASVSDPRGGFFLGLGLGFVSKSIFTVFDRPVGVRGQVKEIYDHYDEEFLDLHAYLGVQITLASKPVPTPAEPVRVVVASEEVSEPVPEPEQIAPPPPPPEPPVETVKKVLTLKGVNFELNSDQLKPESFPILDEAAKTLNSEFPDVRVEVAGHTDSTGQEDYNLDLSKRRAESVRKYLVEQGVDSGRLSSAGYGLTEPVTDNNTKAGRAKNRRVELRIKSN